MKSFFLKAGLSIFLFVSCQKEESVIEPQIKWDLFESADSTPLPEKCRQSMEGVYSITSGDETFGTLAAWKWSYTINDADTVFYFSAFCEKDITYIICEGRRLDSSILLSGYWRTMINTYTGTVRLRINANEGAQLLLSAQPVITENSIIIDGFYGVENSIPDSRLTMSFKKTNYNATPFMVVAHRGGGRSSDHLPASENSIEMMRMASRYGANGIEIDVRLTSDNVPVIYHDETLNDRLIQSNGMVGPIVNYSYTQLNSLVRLINGEHIPTLRQALETIVFETPLEFVWLDMKDANSMSIVRSLQQEFSNKAIASGRTVEIMIGLPEDAVGAFLSLPDFSQSPCVCEPESKVQEVDARIWGASWSDGLQPDAVNEMHSEGRRVIAWTIDDPQFIDRYLNEGNFDGILTNYPSCLAFKYYAKN